MNFICKLKFLDGIVAHAFYPTEGKLHFDADEKWTLNRRDGVNLYQVSAIIYDI